MEKNASFSISIKEGRVEIAGSEDFVREQIVAFKDIIEGVVKTLSTKPIINSGSQTTSVPNSPPIEPPEINPYPNVIALEEDEMRILKSIPGKSNGEKTRKIALLVLLGKKMLGEFSVPTKIIRGVCKDHACLDEKNFSTHLKTDKENLIISGKGASQSVKLSHPGEIKAEDLAKELNDV